MNITPNYQSNYHMTIAPNFKAMIKTDAGLKELKQVASGENFKEFLGKLQEGIISLSSFKWIRIALLNTLRDALQLREIAKDSKMYDVVYDDGFLGISRKGKDTVYHTPFRVLDTYVAGEASGTPYPVIFYDLYSQNAADILKGRINKESGAHSTNVVAEVYSAVEPNAIGNFVKSDLKEVDYTTETQDQIENEIKELAKKLLED